jgi:hypothetical protein
VLRRRVAFRIFGDLPAVRFISIETGKTEQRHRDIVRPRFANSRKTERGGRRIFAGHKVAEMSATVFLNQSYPYARVMLKVRQLVWVNYVAQETGNQGVSSFRAVDLSPAKAG